MTPFELATRFVGEVHELPGNSSSPFIQYCLESCGLGPDSPDSTPWCSAFCNRICWLLRLPRSKSAMARSWLQVGQAIDLSQAVVGSDVVILKRAGGTQGAEVINAPGHVGFFAGRELDRVMILGGNQSDGVTVASWPVEQVLGVRRLA